MVDEMNDDDASTSLVTRAVVALTAAVSVVSAPVLAVVLYVLVKYRHDGPFFAVFKIGLVADVVMLFTQLFGMLQTRVLSSEFFEGEQYREKGIEAVSVIFVMIRNQLHAHNFVQYFLHTYQAFANGYICLNRATAVLFPVHHHWVFCCEFEIQLWDKRATLVCLSIAQFCAACLNGAQSLVLERRVDRYATGERFLIPLDAPSARTVWLRTFIAMVCGDSSIILLYGVVIWKFRWKILHAFRWRAEENDDRHAVSLLLIAVVVVAMEIFYCFFYYLSFIARISNWDDSRNWFAVYFAINCLYSCLPSYLLLIFSSSIRQQVAAVFLRDIAERQAAPAKVSMISIRMESSRRYSMP